MALIPALKEIKDLTPVDGGQEYDLRIIKAQKTKSNRTGRKGVLFIVDIVDEDDALNIMHTIWFGNDGDYTADDEEKSNMMWRGVKEFCRALGFDPDNGIEAEEFEDKQFTAIVEYDDGIEVDEDGKEHQAFAPKNVIGKITGS